LDCEARPAPRHQVVVIHDSWSYFAERFGLAIVAAADRRPACRPRPRAGAALCAHARGRREAADRRPVFDPSLVRQIAAKTGARSVTLLPSGDDYLGLFEEEREAPGAMIELLFWPFVAGLVLTPCTPVRAARARAGRDLRRPRARAGRRSRITVAILYGHPVQGEAAYWYALGLRGRRRCCSRSRGPTRHRCGRSGDRHRLRGVGRARRARLDRAPQGAEHIKQLLIGSILTVTAQEVGALAALYGLIGAAHWVLRRPLIEVSFDPLLAGARAGTCSCGTWCSTAPSRWSSPPRCASPACCWCSPISSSRRRSPASLPPACAAACSSPGRSARC